MKNGGRLYVRIWNFFSFRRKQLEGLDRLVTNFLRAPCTSSHISTLYFVLLDLLMLPPIDMYIYFLFWIKETCVHSFADSTGWVLCTKDARIKIKTWSHTQPSHHTRVSFFCISSSIQSVYICIMCVTRVGVFVQFDMIWKLRCVSSCRNKNDLSSKKKECRVASRQTTAQLYER